MKALWTPTLLLALTGLALGACGDDPTTETDASTSNDVTFVGDVPTNSDTDPGDTTNPNAVRLLDFEQAFGDDQRPCKTQARCTISINFTEQRTLKVVYTEDGVAQGGRTVKFARENDPDNLGFVSTLQSVTEPNGVAQVITKAAPPSRVGQFVIKAYVEGENAPPPKYFDVVVSPKGQVNLTVVARYTGTRPVAAFQANLYRQNAQGSPNCDDMLNLYTNATASQSSPPNIGILQSAKFPEFDGLETDLKQKFTVLAYSLNGNEAIQAWGCDSTVEVEWGKAKTADIELKDRPPLYAGSYDVVSKFDFISAIPEPYRTYVNYVVDFFRSPTQTIVDIVCDVLGSDNSFCDLLYEDNGDPSVLAGFLTTVLDSLIDSLTRDTVFDTIFTVGGDVADILKEFEISATFNLKNEPNAEGVFADGDAHERWHTVKLKWTLGANCDTETEVGCGVQSFSTSAFQGSDPIEGDFKARVANFYDLTIDMHSLNLRYGSLISYFIEAFFIPLATGQPQVNTYAELLGFLVGGGVECVLEQNCVQSSGNTNCCCRNLADNSQGDDANGVVDGGIERTIEVACDTVLKTAPNALGGLIEGLELGTGEAFQLGTKSPCKLSDPNEDLIIDNLGSQAAPCLWNVRLQFGSTELFIDSKFYGKRAEQ